MTSPMRMSLPFSDPSKKAAKEPLAPMAVTVVDDMVSWCPGKWKQSRALRATGVAVGVEDFTAPGT
jgi:hypothetical protein